MTRTIVLPCLPDDDGEPFPPVEHALRDPNGLLAMGGSLRPARLLGAYSAGIFPWYEDGQPVLWWSPDPRLVLVPRQFHASRSLCKRLRRGGFEVSFDTQFAAVIRACAAPRAGAPGTWITQEMIHAYTVLHEMGVAHSVEVAQGGELIGGLYGIRIGAVFFGESMFSRSADSSNIALAHLCALLAAEDVRMIDCQMHTAHLQSLGANLIPRAAFLRRLRELVALPAEPAHWRSAVARPLEWFCRTRNDG